METEISLRKKRSEKLRQRIRETYKHCKKEGKGELESKKEAARVNDVTLQWVYKSLK